MTRSRAYPYHAVSASVIHATMEQAFSHLDDHSRLSKHMSKRSWRMGWGRMELRMDQAAGRAVGSRIRLAGSVFGVRLELDEVVTVRDPPTRKAWETIGTPRLLVIGPYRMGFMLATEVAGEVILTVSIDYSLPERGFSRILGRMFGHWYARWCTRRMVPDAQAAFSPPAPVAGGNP